MTATGKWVYHDASFLKISSFLNLTSHFSDNYFVYDKLFFCIAWFDSKYVVENVDNTAMTELSVRAQTESLRVNFISRLY